MSRTNRFRQENFDFDVRILTYQQIIHICHLRRKSKALVFFAQKKKMDVTILFLLRKFLSNIVHKLTQRIQALQ